MNEIKKALEEAIEDQQTIVRTDVEFDKPESDGDIKPPLTELITLSKEEEDRLRGEVFGLFEELVQERKEHDGLVEAMLAQYKGEIVPEKHMEFSLNVPVTQVKCDAVERLAVRAFTKSEPKFACSLRPEAVRQGTDIASIHNIERNKEDYLDYALDERINIDSPLRKTLHQAVVARGGIMKIPYCYIKKRKIREEFYCGKKKDSGQVDANGQPIYIPEGLKGFLDNYPKATLPDDPGHKYFKQLTEFKDVRFRAKYWATVYDDPKPTFVDTRNFWVRKTAEGYDGLCNEQIYFERVKYTYWELEKMEANNEVVNVDKMKYVDPDQKEVNTKYKIQEHNVLEITYHFKFDGDKDETKVVCRFGEDNKVYLGCYEYPYDNVECIYVPFYIKDKECGFYKSGLAEELTHSNTTQNAMLNMMLTEAWLELVSTPVTRDGSTLTAQLLSHDFKPGVPLTIGPNENINEEIGWLEKPQKAVTQQMIPMLMYLAKMDDGRSGVNDSAATGNADPSDPRAPAAKTALLLKESGVNIEDYIDCLMPSFNKVGEIILQLTYQMSQSGRKFRVKQRAGRVTGVNDIFSEISRDDMILETVVQSQAGSYAFDKIEEINKNTLVWQTLRADPIVSRDPKAIREMARTLLESVSPKWRAKSEKILLSDQEFNQKILSVGVQALQAYMQELMKGSQITGVQANPDMNAYLNIVGQLMAQVSTPTENELENTRKA